MRVSVLKKDLLRPLNPLTCGPQAGGFGAADRGQWASALPRSPGFKKQNPAPSTKVLDRGFFFPASTPWVHGAVSYRGLVMAARGRRPETNLRRRRHSFWEILEGGDLSLVRRKDKPAARPANESHTSSNTLRFYSGAKPHKARKRRRVFAKPALRPASKKKGAKRVAGFKKALRLLPRRRRKIRAYRYLKSIRPRAALWRSARVSPLRVPLAWSKGATESNKAQPRLGLKGGIPRLSPGSKAPQGPSNRPGDVLSTHTGLAPRRGARKKRELRVPQTRYKPGLSKAWRLLRLQFCLAWGLPWLRQRRFTNYVSQLAHITGLNFLKMCLSSVGFIVRASALVPASSALGDKVFVNGRYTVNPFFQVFKGDRVCVVRPPLPSKGRWSIFTSVIEMPPLKGWEVDGLSKTTTVWAEPTLGELRGFVFRKPLPFLSFRMYN